MDEPLETGVLVDSSVLIDFFRKQKKQKSALYRLVDRSVPLYLSVVTVFEVSVGLSTRRHEEDYNRVTAGMDVLPLDEGCIDTAVAIHRELKARNALVGVPDLFIAATAVENELPVATLNRKHFKRIKTLRLVPRRHLVSK